MTGSAVIDMNQPWTDEDGVAPTAARRSGRFLNRYGADLFLAASTVATAVGAGLTARMLCGI